MSKYLEQLLTEIMRAEGLEQPERAAHAAVGALMRVQVLPAVEVERFEADARVYELRGQGVTAPQIAARMVCSSRYVFKAVRRHSKRRRAALRDTA